MAPHDQTDAPSAANPLAETCLKPPLQQALNNLNVHLEDELAHYRRQMHGQSPPPVPKLKVGKGPKQPIDLISVQASEVSPGAAPSAPGPAVPGSALSGAAVVLPPPPPNPFLKDQAADGGMPDQGMPDQGTAFEGVADSSAVDALAEAASEPAVVSDGGNAEAVATSDLSVRQATDPEGYLESSEELLKSLADDPVGDGVAHAPNKPYRPGGMSRLTTPLGMGLLMLLMVGSLGIGYIMLNPSALDAVRAWFAAPSGTAESETAGEEGSSEQTASGEAAVEEGGFSPPGPDLSQREFVELDLDSLSTLDVEGAAPAPATTVPPNLPATTAPPAPLPANNAAQLPAPGTAPGTAPGASGSTAPASATPPSPAAAPATPPAPATAPAPATPAVGRNYYVITNYTGDPSLNKVREVVTDAFVRNFKDGARIQLGAFDNAETAQRYIQELQQQGVTSQLYGPTDE